MPDEEYLDYVSDATDDERYRAIANANRWLQVQRLQRELNIARAEAKAWMEEAVSHRRRLGIPVEPITKRKARKALDATKAPEPASGSDNKEEGQNG